MGHYQDAYDYDEEQNRIHIKKQNDKATEFLVQGKIQAVPANREQFEAKFKEMMFWLNNS